LPEVVSGIFMIGGDLAWRLLSIVVAALIGGVYTRGWLRLHKAQPELAGPERLVALWGGLGILVAVHVSPLYALSEQLLLGRSLQKILVCLVAPPLLWLAVPVHTILWGLPVRWRRGITRRLFGNSPMRRVLRSLTAPGLTWLVFISAFAIWHDATFADWSMQQEWRHRLALWGLFAVAILYWWHVVGTGPRIHPRLPAWVFFAYLIGADIPNMISGVTIAFTGRPIYAYYEAMHATAGYPFNLSVIDDQMIGGGLIWCFGSFIYFGSAVLVIRKLFKDNHGDSPQPFPNWDSDERMIAPGLEHRVVEKRWQAEMPRK
jgi:cytochrome c oxidase assembly factor CtaG